MKDILFVSVCAVMAFTIFSMAAFDGALAYTLIPRRPHCDGILSEDGRVCLPKPSLPQTLELGIVKLLPLGHSGESEHK